MRRWRNISNEAMVITTEKLSTNNSFFPNQQVNALHSTGSLKFKQILSSIYDDN